MSETVIFLGAGATKSCGGPMTDEILPQIVGGTSAHPMPGARSEARLTRLKKFLKDVFHVLPGAEKESYPGLPMLMSILDTALDRRQPLSQTWDQNAISEMRLAVELGIFETLEAVLLKAPTNNHWQLLQRFFPASVEPCVISTNYDLIVDTALMSISESRLGDGRLPDYHCGISTPFYKAISTDPLFISTFSDPLSSDTEFSMSRGADLFRASVAIKLRPHT